MKFEVYEEFNTGDSFRQNRYYYRYGRLDGWWESLQICTKNKKLELELYVKYVTQQWNQSNEHGMLTKSYSLYVKCEMFHYQKADK